MAVGTDDWLRAFEELRPMAAHAGIVAGEISYVRKAARLTPVRGRHLMATATGLLMLLGGVREPRVIDSARWLSPWWTRRAAALRDQTLRADGDNEKQQREREMTTDSC
jgi:hypothetical protein